MIDGRERSEQPDRGEGRIHPPRDGEVADEEAGRDPERDPRVHRRDRKVAGELGGERREQHEYRRVARCGSAGRDEDEHGAERVAGLAEPAQHPLEPDPAFDELEDVPEHHARSHAQRHELEREEEEQRHEDELRRRSESRPDLELDVVGERVGADEHRHDERRDGDPRVVEPEERERDRQEDAAREHARPQPPAAEALVPPGTAVLDRLIAGRVEIDPGAGRWLSRPGFGSRRGAHVRVSEAPGAARSLDRGINPRPALTQKGHARYAEPQTLRRLRFGQGRKADDERCGDFTEERSEPAGAVHGARCGGCCLGFAGGSSGRIAARLRLPAGSSVHALSRPAPLLAPAGRRLRVGRPGLEPLGRRARRQRQRVLLRDLGPGFTFAAPACGELGHEPADVHGSGAARSSATSRPAAPRSRTCGSRPSTRMLPGASARSIFFPRGCRRSRGHRASLRCS